MSGRAMLLSAFAWAIAAACGQGTAPPRNARRCPDLPAQMEASEIVTLDVDFSGESQGRETLIAGLIRAGGQYVVTSSNNLYLVIKADRTTAQAVCTSTVVEYASEPEVFRPTNQ